MCFFWGCGRVLVGVAEAALAIFLIGTSALVHFSRLLDGAHTLLKLRKKLSTSFRISLELTHV